MLRGEKGRGMTSDGGPWGSNTSGPGPKPGPGQQRPERRGGRGILWLGFVAGIGGLVVALAHAHPEAVRAPEDWARVAYYAGFLVLVAAGMFRAGAAVRPQHLRHFALWALIAAALALGYAYRAELAGVPQHLALAFSDGSPVVTGDHELVVPQDEAGGFVVMGKVNGRPVRFLVDTGASDTVLSPEDARRVGVDPARLQFSEPAETANGRGYSAPYEAELLEVGPIAFAPFRLSVNQAEMSTSLLGLSFLGRLESFQVKDHRLILRWRDPPAS
jgi:aspartyl protease family protein